MKVFEFLNQHRIPFELVPHQEAYDSQHLAHALHVPGEQVAKTVLIRANSGYTYIVAVLPATKRIDMQKLSHAFGESHIALATELEIKDFCKDCELGVLPPFGTQYCLKTVVDQSLASAEYIYFEAETHREAIRMKYKDFQRVEEPLTASFAV